MGMFKQLLALVLAVALTVTTMSVAFAQGGSSVVGASGIVPGFTSGQSITIEGKDTVKLGETTQYTAQVINTGVVGYSQQWSWSVDNKKSVNTTIDNTGKLTVGADETSKMLTISANDGFISGTKNVTVTHGHTADCFTVYINYDGAANPGINCAHMDLSEGAPHTNYVSFIICLKDSDPKLSESTIRLSVEGELKDKLVITAPAKEYGDPSSASFAGRFTLAKGAKLDPGTYTVPVNIVLTVDGIDYSFKEDIQLLAVAGNPIVIDNEEDTGATFVVDLLDPQLSYTSTPAAVTLPEGMEIESVTPADEYKAKYFKVDATKDGLTVTTKLYDNEIRLENDRLLLRVKLKGFETPITATLLLRTVLENQDIVSLNYKPKASLPTDAKLDIIPVVADVYKGLVKISRIKRINIEDLRISDIYKDYSEISNVKYFMSLEEAGEWIFDAQATVSATVPYADGINKLYIDAATSKILGNKLEVTGNFDDLGLESFSFWRTIDLNDTDTFKQSVKLKPTNGASIGEISFVAEGGGSIQSDKINDLFTVDYGTAAADGSREVTLTFKNEEDIVLDKSKIRYNMLVALEGAEGTPMEPMNKTLNFTFVASAPEATMYAHGTDTVVKEDIIAVKESRKYDIRVNNYKGINGVWLYNGDQGTEIIRGIRFLSDRNPTETITVVGNRTSEDSFIEIEIDYKPVITNQAVKVTLSNDLLMTSTHKLADIYVGSRPDDDDDDDNDDDNDDDDDDDNDDNDDDDNDNNGGGDNGGNNDSSNNNANTPAVSEKINSAVAAVKKLDKLTSDKLPAGVQVTQTANGTSIATVPVALTSGNATLGMGLVNALGHASSNVGLELTIAHSIQDKIKIILPGGFGKITEPGRIGFPMDYNPVAPAASTMLAQVKGEKVVSSTAQIGGNFTLPVAATVTVKSKAPEGSTVNIYKYDPLTRKMIFVASAKVANGNITFDTKTFGQMIFTTGKIQ